MSLLHDYFNTRNLQLFQRLLENAGSDRAQNAGPSTSGGRSWKKHGVLGHINVDVNCRDWLGRTVLHLASASIEHLEYVRALLKHPAINVNLPDTESHWTPLHRSLYNANLPAARLLLQRPDIDVTVKDNEGYTAFDLYNSTLIGTKPSLEEGDAYADLFTWGANVNAALGLGDSNDRVHPEQVTFPPKDDTVELEKQNLSTRFLPVRVKHVEMSKLHTAVITSESGGNLRVCGFGSGGRLGPSSHTQYSLKPLVQFSQTIVSIALGQDHTLALTKHGEVLSWGLNRFSQLGYPVDPPTGGRTEEPIQYAPRKVQGVLRKEFVKGVAASKCASACWTEDSVYTWGTNNGQLGYDKAAQPVQVLPRKVSRLALPVISVAMTENAMACLMQNHQVECFYNDGHHRINFPTHTFPSPIRPYRPPQAAKDSRMAKITSCGDVFASLSYHGEVYIFSPTNSASSSATATSSANTSNANDPEGSTRTGGPFKCQRVWALRKKSSAVRDVALGVDGSIIICTESGHVFVRTRNVKSSSASMSQGGGAKAFKFVRVPMLQRVTRVCANASGAFGALRVDFRPKCIDVKGNLVSQDLVKVQPWVDESEEDARFAWMKRNGGEVEESWTADAMNRYSRSHSHTPGQDSDNEDLEGETEDDAVENDIRVLKEMCDTVKREERRRKEGVKVEDMKLLHGADTLVTLDSGAVFPVHRVMLAARSEALCRLLSAEAKKSSSVRDEQRNIKITLLPPLCRPNYPGVGPGTKRVTRLSITGVHALSVLVLLHYLYSDNVVAVWDRRVSLPVELYAKNLKVKFDPAQIKNEVQVLARMLGFRQVLRALERPVKCAVVGTMVRDLTRLFKTVNRLVLGTASEAEEGDGEFKAEEWEGGSDAEEWEGDFKVEETSVELQTKLGDIPKALTPDVVLELRDKEIRTHSAILRSRSEFFQNFFNEPDWTRKRWDSNMDGDVVVRINLKHLKWQVMEYVLKFVCCGCDKELFERLEFVRSVDDLVEFMFEVVGAANELLLDRLVLLCSDVILTYSNIHNACYILADATYFSATQLVDRIQSYITANMELFLESHMLDDIPPDLVLQLARFAQDKQKQKAPFVRGGQLADMAMERWKDWLEMQDVPKPFVRSSKQWQEKKNALPIPKFEKPVEGLDGGSKLRRSPSADDIFVMDDPDRPVPAPAPESPLTGISQQPFEGSNAGGPAWKIYVAPKVDMKAVMAEAAASQVKPAMASRRPSEAPSRLQWTPLSSATASPQAKDSSQLGWPRKTQSPSQEQQGDETPRGSPPGPTSLQPSTPQKQKTPVRPSASQGKTPSSNQLPNMTPTKLAQGSSSMPSGPVMGPTITPTRMPASSLKSNVGQRNASGSNKAWAYTRPVDNLTPAMLATQSTSKATANGSNITNTASATASTSKSVSFVAIQHSQKEEQSGDPSKDQKRSLLEIQEEEKARRQEEEFLRWWEEEEMRVKLEMEALEAFSAEQNQGQGQSSGGGRGGSGRHRKGGGKGRGGSVKGGEGGNERGERSERGERGERVEKRGGAAGGGKGGPKGRKEGKSTVLNEQAHGADVPSENDASGAAPSSTRLAQDYPYRRHRKPSQKKPLPAAATG